MEEGFDPLAAAIAISPFVVGLVEGAKATGLPARWSMVGSLAFGLLIAGLFALAGWAGLDSENWATAVLVGIAAGLMAVGLYSGFQSVTGKGDAPMRTNGAP
jgi:hypothetical protein